jgi:hypothetical protein
VGDGGDGAGAGVERRVSGEDETLSVEGSGIQGSAPPRRRAGGREGWAGGMGVAVEMVRRGRVSNAWGLGLEAAGAVRSRDEKRRRVETAALCGGFTLQLGMGSPARTARKSRAGPGLHFGPGSGLNLEA